MKTYDKYKSSGIDWIGDIPEHWKTVSLKWVSKIYSGGTPDRNRSEYWTDGTIPWLNSGVVNQFKITKPSEYITEEGYNNSSAKWIDENSIVIALAGQGKTKGMSALVTFKTTGNQSLGVIKPIETYDSRFLLYFLRKNYFFIRGLAGEGIRDGLNLGVIGSLSVPLFDISEQTAIADYLDEKTAQIDKLMVSKRRLIELLKEERLGVINQAVTRGINRNAKLKPSGIAWLGDIPEHWEVKKLKWVCQIIDCKHITPNYLEIGIAVVSTGNVKPFEISLDSARKVSLTDFEQLSEGDRKPLKNDIIYSRNASVGAAALVRTEEDFCLGQDICLIRSEENQDFLENVLNCKYVSVQLESVLVGSTFRRINIQQIKEFFIILPPMEEQKQIVEFIESATGKIDATIATIEKEIGFLREYRTALISEVVTGKIKIV